MKHRYTSTVLALAALVLGGRVEAQNANPIFDTETQSLPSAEFLTLANQYLQLDMRVPELARTIDPGDADDPASFVGWSNYRGGRVFIQTTSGDPFTDTDNGVDITNRSPLSTFSTIRLSDIALGTNTDDDIDGDTYDVESTYGEIDDPTQEIFLQQPVSGNRGLTYTWRIREGLEEHETPVLNTDVYDNDGLTGYDGEERVVVTQTYSLVRDMVRVEVEVVNVSDRQQYVGVETYVDSSFGGATDDGTEFYITGNGDAITTEYLFPSANTSDDLSLRRIPEAWRTFDNISRPGVILGGIWGGADVATAANTAGVPDAAMFVNANLSGPNGFGYNPLGLSLAGANWAVLVRWEDVLISPGSSRKFITYFGLAGSTSEYEQPYVLSCEAPFNLALGTGDDPATAAQEDDSHVYRTPNPFTVRAFVNNISTRSLSDVSVSLALPQGFSLANSTDSTTQNIAAIPAGSEVGLSWDVVSETSQPAGTHTITVSASGAGVASRLVEREIGVPALPVLEFPSITRRLDMISVPYDFANRDLENIFTSLGTIGVSGAGNAALARYNPSVRSYAYFPDTFFTTLRPGEGLWLFNGSLADLTLPGDRSEVATTSSVSVNLGTSWNQIGCPYTVPARLYDCEVITSDNVSRTFADAVNAGIVRPVIYEYVPNTLDPSEAGTYEYEGDSNTTLDPWRGYWLRTLQDVTLVFSSSSVVGPFRGAAQDPLALRGGWEAALRMSAGQQQAQAVRIGMDPSSTDGYDVRDVDAPPVARSQSLVQLTVQNADWGRNAGAYLRDIRSSGTRSARWLVRADCAAANQQVTLRWDLREVPGDLQLTLVDLETGQRRHMRTTAGYTYDSGPLGRSRLFEVKATRGTSGRVAVQSMLTTPGRGGSTSISFALNQAAEVDIVIESLAGRKVRTVATGFAAEPGLNAVHWDGRDDSQRRVPNGTYRCRVLVHTEDGDRAVAERQVIVNH